MDSSNSKNSSLGVAPIKPEFLIGDRVRELDLNFVSSKDKKRFSENNEEKSDSEGPQKKKLKGQNKHRPRNKLINKSDNLCFKIGTEGSCPFGDSCCYSHDVQQYLATKPEDIHTSCYLFKTFGRCPYSYSCRFGTEHLKDGQNVVNEAIWNVYKDKKMFTSLLTRDMQTRLRKRNYNFQKSEMVLKKFNDILSKRSNKQESNAKVSERNSSGVHDMQGDVELSISADVVANLVSKTEMIEKENQSPITNLPDAEVNQSCREDAALFEKEIKKIDFKNKLYLAPLTTVGNLPFRRICKEFGADITCSEMAVAVSLLQGHPSEWALVKRHHTEDIFGIQLCGAHPDIMTKCSQVLSEQVSFDFIDLNLGCPLDALCKKGAGCGLMNRMKKLEGIVYGVSSVINVPFTIKMRKGIHGGENIAHSIIAKLKEWDTPLSLITLHGRSREQRYTKSADWSYIDECSKLADPIPLFGNGDILSYEDYKLQRESTSVAGAMIARGALIKPWIFQEIKNQNNWDISSSERLELLQRYTNYGLEHWGSDTQGVEKTRRFMLEWLSFLYRYIPVGLLERVPQRINERPPPYFGRNELETLMASPSCSDWIKISEMLLGPVPENFIFLPKHKANAYK